ncbi:MAG: release factor glutamine methyltransferase [Thermoleophilaceae bacterium]|nr:release factor glutamine methyltransferase [Thermoleophilaceae bacterium]
MAEAVVSRLRAAGCVAAEEEAHELVSRAPDAGVLESWLRRREQGEPLAWIIGGLEFCGRWVHVAPGVYVPRIQSEDLARRAAALLPREGRALDLCTGAGAIAAYLQAEVPRASVVGVDLDPIAVACAESNGVRAVAGDIDDAAVGPDHSFDVVTAVPPYVPTSELRLLPADVQRYEPRVALDGGADGLEPARRIVAVAGRLLAPGGWLLIEVGGDQDELIAPALASSGFGDAEPWHDEDGDLRGVASRFR